MLIVPFDRPGLKEPAWENVIVGEEFGPLDMLVSDHAVKSYLYATDDYHPWYLHDSPFDGRIAPAALVTRPLLDLLHLEYDATRLRALHVREELELFGPLKVGQQVTVRARVEEKFLKRGEPYVVLVGYACDKDGKTLIRTRQGLILRSDVRGLVGRNDATPNNGVVTGGITAGAPTAERASHSAAIGSMIPSIRKDITLEQMFVFSFGVPNIHTDRAIAWESGLAAPIAQGLMSTGYLSQLLTDFFGVDWFESGWTSHAFIKPVSAGDTITVYGKIKERSDEASGTRVVLEVWCRNQLGELTTVGSASALVTSDGLRPILDRERRVQSYEWDADHVGTVESGKLEGDPTPRHCG
jgi:acyl dehydratase